jgi:hypothetical protein
VRPTLTCKVVWWQWGQVIISTVYLAPTTLATPRFPQDWPHVWTYPNQWQLYTAAT